MLLWKCVRATNSTHNAASLIAIDDWCLCVSSADAGAGAAADDAAGGGDPIKADEVTMRPTTD